MFRGFNLELGSKDLSQYAEEGREIHKDNKNNVGLNLESFKEEDGNLLASKIIADWFPPIAANVFLSHSHKDEMKVIELSGWLKKKFGLTSFIDSCIWGYSDLLLRKIDNEYCLNASKKTYSYEKRNRSTSHVHMMLSTALIKMIDSCECIIFVNTPNSISSKNYIEEATTDSPWIYSEIAMTSLVQKRSPNEHRGTFAKSIIAMDAMNESLKINYDVDLMHLTPLNDSDLSKWSNSNNKIGAAALDTLYKLKAGHHGG